MIKEKIKKEKQKRRKQMKSKMFRKVLSIVLICAMLTMSMGAYSGEVVYATQSFESNNEKNLNINSENIFEFGNRTYIEEYADNNDYTLSAYENGVLVEKVTLKEDSSELICDVYEYQEKDSFRSINQNELVKRNVIDISDYISVEETSVVNASNSGYYQIMDGEIGSIRFEAIDYYTGYYYPVIDFTSKYIDSNNGMFNVSGGEGVTLSALIVLISAGFNGFAGAELAAGILGVINIFTNSAVENLGTITIMGDVYLYNITGTTKDGRSRTEGAETYYGSVKKDGIWINNQKAYGEYYPEFIIEEDISVAMIYFQSFYTDVFSVDEYIPT